MLQAIIDLFPIDSILYPNRTQYSMFFLFYSTTNEKKNEEPS